MARPPYAEALRDCGVLDALAEFDPHVAGSPPLRLDLPTSDIDILCCAPDAEAFTGAAWTAFSEHAEFAVRQRLDAGRAVVASFLCRGWTIEIFADPAPVAAQAGWRHFQVEQRLLRLAGERLRSAVMRRRRAGAKTEPAFAAALGLPGDPYASLLELAQRRDDDLLAILARAGFPVAI